MKAYIKSISYYLPETVVTNEDIGREFPDWPAEKISKKIGIHERHIASENETSADMAVSAAEMLFKEHNIDRTSIDYLLLCTQSPDYFLPASSCIIQEKLNLRTDAGALDFNQGCSGFVYGLSLAKGLISSGICRNVLLITSETYSKYIHKLDRSNRTIFGDAAAATLISVSGFAEIGNFSFGTDGKGAKNLIVETGGLRCFNRINRINFDENNNPISPDHLFMNGSEIFNFTLEAVPILTESVMEMNNLNPSDIDLYVFHQANKYMLEFLRKKMLIEPEKFYYCLEKVGNTVSSTIPIALKEGMSDNSIKKGNKIVIAGFGVGYSWAGSILNY
jgi:3-oxoacyl-[acyl-carrier-protein] synthase-3